MPKTKFIFKQTIMNKDDKIHEKKRKEKNNETKTDQQKGEDIKRILVTLLFSFLNKNIYCDACTEKSGFLKEHYSCWQCKHIM